MNWFNWDCAPFFLSLDLLSSSSSNRKVKGNHRPPRVARLGIGNTIGTGWTGFLFWLWVCDRRCRLLSSTGSPHPSRRPRRGRRDNRRARGGATGRSFINRRWARLGFLGELCLLTSSRSGLGDRLREKKSPFQLSSLFCDVTPLFMPWWIGEGILHRVLVWSGWVLCCFTSFVGWKATNPRFDCLSL
jgi:hypothetical protein